MQKNSGTLLGKRYFLILVETVTKQMRFCVIHLISLFIESEGAEGVYNKYYSRWQETCNIWAVSLRSYFNSYLSLSINFKLTNVTNVTLSTFSCCACQTANHFAPNIHSDFLSTKDYR